MPCEPRLENLLRPDVLARFDREKFERDGYWVWEGILTDEGQTKITATLQRLQAMQDYMVMHTDWAEGIDWAARDLPPPPRERLTTEWRQSRVCGGSEQLSYYPPADGRPAVGKGFLNMATRAYMADTGLFGSGADRLATDGTWPSQGHVPEFAPLCHSPFLFDVATSHPQMMQLFSKLFNGQRFCIDHANLLNRKQGEGPGRHWHGHRYDCCMPPLNPHAFAPPLDLRYFAGKSVTRTWASACCASLREGTATDATKSTASSRTAPPTLPSCIGNASAHSATRKGQPPSKPGVMAANSVWYLVLTFSACLSTRLLRMPTMR